MLGFGPTWRYSQCEFIFGAVLVNKVRARVAGGRMMPVGVLTLVWIDRCKPQRIPSSMNFLPENSRLNDSPVPLSMVEVF